VKYFFCIIFLFLFSQTYADKWEVDISQCTKVIERFFVNGKENRDVSPQDYYYDVNGNLVLQIFYDSNGRERGRKISRYNELNELIEYRDIFGGHRIIEKIVDNDKIIFLKRKKEYNDYDLIGIEIYNTNGNLISEFEIHSDNFFSYRIYNDRKDLIFNRYEDEKSNGIREERIINEYDSNFNRICVKTYENDILKYETVYTYSDNNLLLQAETFDNLRIILSKKYILMMIETT
jgi:hypothetical protein